MTKYDKMPFVCTYQDTLTFLPRRESYITPFQILDFNHFREIVS